MNLTERRFSKRELLIASVGIFIAGCNNNAIEITQGAPTKETKNNPQPGDLVVINGNFYLPRNKKLYLIPYQELEKYKKNTKFEKYGRKVFVGQNSGFEQYPTANIPNLPMVIDWFTGVPKTNKLLGGEINVYFAGFLTDGGMPYDIIYPDRDTFVKVRTMLEKKGWSELDSLFFTYGDRFISEGGKVLPRYTAEDTKRDPGENIKNALDYFVLLKDEFPLAQFNLIAHSLGGLFALAIAQEHYDAINNLILINSPIKGISRNLEREIEVRIMHVFVGDEKVTKYLFDLRDNQKYQREIQEFVSAFINSGRNLTTVIDEADPIVPVESSRLEGANEIFIPKDNKAVQIQDLLAASVAHSRPLRDDKVIEELVKPIGENLAAAA